MDKDNIQNILDKYVEHGDWKIENAVFGRSKTTYIGSKLDMKVFIKMESASEALTRLSEIGIAPKVLYSSNNANDPILIQEFVDGTHPDNNWFEDNSSLMAQLFKKYHSDKELTNILKKSKESNYNRVVDSLINWMKEWADEVDVFPASKIEKEHIARLIAARPQNVVDPLVPIHADTNRNNYILNNNNVYIVDWDDVHLSDPLRDTGQFLWEHIPQSKWDTFYHEYGLEITPDRKDRLFWWIAAMKLIVAFWHYLYPKETDKYKKILGDSIHVWDSYRK